VNAKLHPNSKKLSPKNKFMRTNMSPSLHLKALAVSAVLLFPLAARAQTFTGRNVGTPAQSGSATVNANGTITLTGGGDDIWNNSDNFYYYYTPVTGLAWDAVVRVMSLDGPDWWSKAALMVRRPALSGGIPQGADPHISNMLTRTNGQNDIELQYRGTRAGGSGNLAAPSVTPKYPQWLRVQRSNTVFILYYGSNGTTDWVRYASIDTSSTANGFNGVPWENPILVGVAVTAHNNTPPNVATTVITNLAVYPTTPPTLVGVQTQIQNATGYNGIEATFTFVATNNAILNFYGMQYRWYKNNQLVSTNPPGTQYTFVATTADNNAQIYCVANVQAPYSSLTVTSAVATLTVLPWTVGSWIWWEAENPSTSNIPASTWLSPGSQSERDALSGGNILTAVSIKTTGPYWANYNVNVAQAGTYRFYVRKIAGYGVFKWRFDSAAWSFANSQLQLIDSADYKPYFGLNWVYLGDVTLAAGAHVFRVEMNAADWPNPPDNSNADFGGFDAFMLSAQPFIPRGKLKPSQKYNLAEPGKWNFEALPDIFSSTALLDLRSLNESVAGQSGFVRVAGDQSGKYILGDGTPVRFWGVNVGNNGSDYASLSQQAKFLAKRGVNLVRYFHQLPTSDPNNINAVDPAYIEGAQRTVAAFKQEGIYTEFGLYYELTFTIRKEWGVDGYTNDVTGPSEILMFDEKLKAAYKEWVRQLFTATNAYTGLTLAQDPAVAIIEIQNEDSFLFWTDPTTFPPAEREKLESKFGAFLLAKYGSLAAAQTAWGQVTIPNQPDDPANGRMAVAIPWYMTWQDTNTYPWWPVYTPRMADQIQFLTELQRAFYQEMRDYYRNTLGCQSLIESCNWMTADERFLADAERYTYTANDVIDKHPYFNPVHVNPNSPGTGSYAVSVGDYYQSIAAVKNPRSMPAAYKQVTGFPRHASETTWVNPTRFKAEGPLLVAAYNSMADIDGWVWFATGSLAYEDNMNKFQVSVPSLMGQFPGAALLYRRGDVAEASVAVREERNLSRIYNKEFALISGFDPTRNPPDNPVYDPQTGTGRIDPLAMLVGKVECNYKTNDAANYVSPLLFSQMDMTNQIVESLPAPGNTNGQLKLDWGKGLFRVNSPRSQGIAGFLNSVGQVDLDDVSLTSSNEFGAILVIALDNLPIAQSQKILIQAMTEDNPYHWQEQDQVFTNNNVVYAGKKILSMGQPPMNVVNINGAVTLKGLGQGHSFTVHVLDENGYDRSGGSSQVMGPDLKITLPPNSLYTVVMATPPAPPIITSVSPSGGAFSLTWSAVAGQVYQVQFKTDLNQTNWTPLGSNLTASSSTLTASDSMTNAQRFYRVMRLQ
jgi:hypothetical protein